MYSTENDPRCDVLGRFLSYSNANEGDHWPFNANPTNNLYS
jgi:hypothetical protein